MNIIKSIKFSVLLMMILTTSLTSCNKDDNELLENKESIIHELNKVENKELINEFITLQKSMVTNKVSNNITFDNSAIYKVTLKNSDLSLLVANQVSFDENNSINYGISAAITEKGLSKSFIIKTDKTSENIYTITYLNTNFEPLADVVLDAGTETINVLNQVSSQTKGCGQGTADCLNDAYTNHGWISVWATVQTAFIPATAAALATACAIENCI